MVRACTKRDQYYTYQHGITYLFIPGAARGRPLGELILSYPYLYVYVSYLFLYSYSYPCFILVVLILVLTILILVVPGAAPGFLDALILSYLYHTYTWTDHTDTCTGRTSSDTCTHHTHPCTARRCARSFSRWRPPT